MYNITTNPPLYNEYILIKKNKKLGSTSRMKLG
jgi:hypothetical protein